MQVEIEQRIENMIRVWAKRHEHSVVVSKSEIDELAERIFRIAAELIREARKDGIREYSWMKNGHYYVGTTGKTLKTALDEVDQEMPG
jgi:hypothetical protein